MSSFLFDIGLDLDNKPEDNLVSSLTGASSLSSGGLIAAYAFVAGFVYSYLKTENIWDSIEVANDCATQVVQKKGTAKIDIKELKNRDN